MTRPIYDYIIVGAGASGCVLANRLSADPSTTVVLIEAGPRDDSRLIGIPRAIGKLLAPGTPYVSAYQASSGVGGPVETWMKGRGIGGSTIINGMGYARGAPLDYDHWEALGCTGWGWDEMARRFTALEDHVLGPGEGRGVGGPLRISVHRTATPLTEAILSASQGLGTARVADFNTSQATTDGGLGYQPSTTFRGRRVSAADAFLHPIERRPNLHVLTGTKVSRILFEGKQATGVIVDGKEGTRTIHAARETIVSAGAIESPKLLQLSGIGPGAPLHQIGIPVVVDARDVGRNLREHRYVPLMYRVRGGSLNRRFSGMGLVRSVVEYMLGGRGPLSHAAQELGGFVKTRHDLAHADAQIAIGLYSMRMGESGVTVENDEGITIITYFTRPESQGTVRVVSPDHKAPPAIEANQLSTDLDRTSSVAAIRWVRALVQQPALAPWIVEETAPGPALASDRELSDAFLGLGGPCYHACGTVRMGGDPDAPLDPQLRVRGVRGLRVVDTSIMPTITSGNTAGPAMAIAMRASDLLISDRLTHHP